MHEIQQLQRQGVTISHISRLTGYSRQTVRKYLAQGGTPRYGPRPKRPSKLDPFESYIEKRLLEGVWNGVVLWRELREQGYTGGYTILSDSLRPKRQAAYQSACRRFETPAGHQAQVDWGHVGHQQWPDGPRDTLSGFVLTLGYSRAHFADITTDRTLGCFLRLHEAAFEQLEGIPQEILYDWTKTVVLGVDERGETRWHPVFEDFARYWGFVPRLCRPYRAQTKGKVESGIRYLKGNFLCGRRAASLEDLRSQLRVWTWEVAHQRVHGTTHRRIFEAWEEEKPSLQRRVGHPPFPYFPEVSRRVSRDAYISYRGNRYSVPWQAVGHQVRVLERAGVVEVWRDHDACLATHVLGNGRHQVFTVAAHHQGIPLEGGRSTNKPSLLIQVGVPQVQVRPLMTYQAFAERGEGE